MFLDYFDEVYVINLKRRIDRRAAMQEQLDLHGIPFTFFEATDNEANGVAGLIDSMKRLFTHALEKRQERILVFEDDCAFLVAEPIPFLQECLKQLPRDFQLFYLGLNLLSRPLRISENILKVVDCYSTHCIAYSRSAMIHLLKRLNQVEPLPYDQFIRNEILYQNRSYCTFPMLVTQSESYSDIEKSQPQWGKLMTVSFNTHTRNLQVKGNEIAYCHQGHAINGHVPMLDENKHEVQYPEYIGRVCDCKRFLYGEGLCDTCGGEKWKVIWKEKV